MMEFIWSVIGFILVMGVIVTIHEYGHFQVARWFNVKVTDFSIGFGKALYQKQMGEVRFKIAMIPLGGYVKFVDEREGDVAAEDLPRAFNRQSVYKRFAIVAAGPMINLLLAWWVFAAMQMIGMNTLKPLIEQSVFEQFDLTPDSMSKALPAGKDSQLWEITSVNGESVHSWQNINQQILLALIADNKAMSVAFTSFSEPSRLIEHKVPLTALDINNPDQGWLKTLGFVPAELSVEAVAGKILQGEPAALAGIEQGDRITQFNGQAVESWQAFVSMVQAHPGQTVELLILRQGELLLKGVNLKSVENPESGLSEGRIGMGVDVTEASMQPYMNDVQFGVFDALVLGYERTLDLLKMSLQMLKRMILGEVSLSHLSGPISIAQFSGQAVQSGFISFLSLLGLLSLSVGFLNLLPIPVLDGGHLLYYLVEMIKGSPVNEKVMLIGQNVGLFLIVCLTLLALFNDVIRLSNG